VSWTPGGPPRFRTVEFRKPCWRRSTCVRCERAITSARANGAAGTRQVSCSGSAENLLPRNAQDGVRRPGCARRRRAMWVVVFDERSSSGWSPDSPFPPVGVMSYVRADSRALVHARHNICGSMHEAMSGRWVGEECSWRAVESNASTRHRRLKRYRGPIWESCGAEGLRLVSVQVKRGGGGLSLLEPLTR